MNICGCLAHVAPDHASAAARAMKNTQGVEIHAETEDGRFVVVVEDTPTRLASETIMDLHQIPGVISLTLTYHHFEDLADADPQPDAPSPTTSRRPKQ
ncbi:chaperone NapD [Ruegeria arenilitoris]|uniref:chaperone NapD n=1 Tax=Ruegeria arenilitoris TaxID=1173585 RepID=UPI00147EED7F|nr:chaperone NapD [Ruegeria arenilitoris]